MDKVELRELATEFSLVASDQLWERFAGRCLDVRMAALNAIDIINVPYQRAMGLFCKDFRNYSPPEGYF